jgi:exo-beta-1,3-glucanase (GH17 family)
LRGVVVGNEAVFREEITVEILLDWVAQTRVRLEPLSASIGRTIEVSASDVFVVYLRSQPLMDALDFLVPNMHIYYNRSIFNV